MTLRVPFQGFAAAVERHLKGKSVYVHDQGAKVLITAAEDGTTIVSSTKKSLEAVKEELHQSGLHVHQGIWSVDDDAEILELPHIGIVSYRANKDKTAIWAEVYAVEPTAGQVLDDFAQEIAAEAGIAGIPTTEFLEAAQASVLVLTASRLEGLQSEKGA